MSDSTVKLKRDVVNDFWLFIIKRHNAFLRRIILQTPAPWSQDKIIQEVNFCNIFRDYDYGTRFELECINICGDKDLLIKNILTYRLFNWPDTHLYIAANMNNHLNVQTSPEYPGVIFGMDHNYLLKIMRFRKANGDKWRSNAYTVINSIDKFCDRVYDWWSQSTKAVIDAGDNLHEVWKAIGKTYKGTGTFIAYEIATDLTYSPLFNLDQNDFVNPGPGCRLGIDLITEQKCETDEAYMDVIKYLTDNQHVIHDVDTDEEPWVESREFTLRDVEHSFCEYFKYIKRKNGGHRKRMFIPNPNPPQWYLRSLEKLRGHYKPEMNTLQPLRNNVNIHSNNQ